LEDDFGGSSGIGMAFQENVIFSNSIGKFTRDFQKNDHPGEIIDKDFWSW